MSFFGGIASALGFGNGSHTGTGFRGSTPGNVPLEGIQDPVNLDQANALYNQSLQGLGMYQNLANGLGPNPALAQLNQTTLQNVNNQAALMNSQRGANANPGLIARQAAMQGANVQQQAAGQAATLNAQQQLAGIQGYNQAAQSEQQQLLNAMAQQNSINAGMQGNLNNVNAGIANSKTGMESKAIGSLGGVGGALPMMAMMASGGAVPFQLQSFAAKFLAGGPKSIQMQARGGAIHGEALASKGKKVPGKASVKGDSLKNDNVPAMLSPGEVVIPRSVMQSSDPVKNSAKFVAAVMAKQKKGK